MLRCLSNRFSLGLLFSFAVVFLIACNDSEPDCGDPDSIQQGNFRQKLSLYIIARNNYFSDQSQTNCNRFRNAGRNYIGASTNLVTCVSISDRPIYENAIATTEEAIAELDCS